MTTPQDNLAQYREKLHSILSSRTPPTSVNGRKKPSLNVKQPVLKPIHAYDPKDKKISELEKAVLEKNEKIVSLSKLNSSKDRQINDLKERVRYLELTQENKDLKIEQLQHLISDLKEKLYLAEEAKVKAVESIAESTTINNELVSDDDTTNLNLDTERLINLNLQDLSFDTITKSHNFNTDIYNTHSVVDSDDNSDLENYLFDV
ncbi:hypothetical protein CANINC_000888 [Pichia inconspicua]|uniref:Uncharacterized protein n=1 Tax=Pichia inconspicua TaxID=52247 RepID=A0A4T0X6Q5_9ASCO|nr:hypothetical protein CANINC_000888 [[Candida] inconspicua]